MRDHNSTSLMYLNWFQSLSYREHRCHEAFNEACQDICWSPLVAHQRLHDNGVLAISVAGPCTEKESGCHQQLPWRPRSLDNFTDVALHIVNGLCLEDGLRGLSHCLDSKDSTTPSNLTTDWLGWETARLHSDSHSFVPGYVPEVSCEDGGGMASASQTLYAALAFLEVLYPLLVVQTSLAKLVHCTQTLWLTGAEWLYRHGIAKGYSISAALGKTRSGRTGTGSFQEAAWSYTWTFFLLAWAQLFSLLVTVIQSSKNTQQPPDR